MRMVSLFCALGIVLSASSSALSDSFRDTYYGDSRIIAVERDGKIIDRLPCERIPLDFPDLAGRGEAHVAFDSKGDIWAGVGVTVGSEGPPRLFHSRDGGRSWTSQLIEPTKDGACMVAFTVLKDDTMLMALSIKQERVKIYASADMGKTWKQTTTLMPAPLQCIGEGTESLTQLSDGRVLFPVVRFTHPGQGLVLDKRVVLSSIYVSQDGGKTFPVAHSTFDDGLEAHVLGLQSGRLLGAFRYQRSRRPDETSEQITAMGGRLEKKKGDFVFKNVFLGDSDDGGVTWKNLRPVRDAKGRALLQFGECYGRLAQVPDGRVVLVHDKRYPYENGETLAQASRDGGQTFEPEVYHISFGAGYPSSVVLRDGTIVTATGNGLSTSAGRPLGPRTAQVIRWKLP